MTKNINYVSHKKSKVKNNGKPQLPSANSLVEGEIAINYAKDVETLSIKNESGTVVTFSSDNYYTEKKLGSGFTESNSAVTVTDAIFKVEKAISDEASRATAAESALSSGKADKATTLAGYGITDAYTKSQTYTQTEVNRLVSTPHQNYVTVATYASLPATGSADTIYRVSNWDGSANSGAGAVDVTVYSEYAWNGSSYTFLCVKSQIGEVFDISVYNGNAKYDTLAEALGTNGEHVPQSIRRGGMSVKYVQNSDNKYAQYRLMTTSFSTTVSDWQGVDEELAEGSKNFIESGTVYSSILTSVCLKEVKDMMVLRNTAFHTQDTSTHDLFATTSQSLCVKYYQVKTSGIYFVVSYNISQDISQSIKTYLHKIGIFDTEPAVGSVPIEYISRTVTIGETTISRLHIDAGKYIGISYSDSYSKCSLISNAETIEAVSDEITDDGTNPVSSIAVKNYTDEVLFPINLLLENINSNLTVEDTISYTRLGSLKLDRETSKVKTAGTSTYQVAYTQIPLNTNYYNLIIESTDNVNNSGIQILGVSENIPADDVSYTQLDYKAFTNSGDVYKKELLVTNAIKGKYLVISTHQNIPISIVGKYIIDVVEEFETIDERLDKVLTDNLTYQTASKLKFDADTSKIVTAGTSAYGVSYYFIPSDTPYDKITVASTDGVSNALLRYIGITEAIPANDVAYTQLDYTRFWNTGNVITKNIPITDEMKGKYLVVSVHTTSNLTLTGHGVVDRIESIEEDVQSLDGRVSNVEEELGKVPTAKLVNRKTDIRKSGLKVFHIGNSFMNGSLAYLYNMVVAANVDVSDMCIYGAYRGGASFTSWYNCYHDQDSESCSVSKKLGGITLENVEGSSPAYDGTAFRNALNNAQWDIIIIQPDSGVSIDFADWETTEHLIELVRLIRTLQPQAEIGINFIHAAYSVATSKGMTQVALWEGLTDAYQKFTNKYDVDFLIPYGTAIENIKMSSINTTTYGFEHDGKHLADGVGKYVASAAYFQSLIAPRYGVSILGNTYRHDVTDEKPSATYPNELISVTNDNAYVCQMAAIMACNDFYSRQNPDGVTL